jgi:hypothetical protein
MKLLDNKLIKIGDKDYLLKMSIRAMIEYEQLSGHSISIIESLKDITTIFYCTFKAGGNNMSYDEFMDLIDDKPESIKAFSDSMIEKVEKKSKAR